MIRRCLSWCVLMLSIAVLLGALAAYHLRFNLSASLPIGWYQRVIDRPVARGDLVAVCLPSVLGRAAKARGYLFSGTCSGGVTPLLKRVIGLPGDTIRLLRSEICVNQRCYKAPMQSQDRHGLPPIKTVSARIFLHTKRYWLYGSNDVLHSWDSRYFGGVLHASIQGIYRPIWTLHGMHRVQFSNNNFRHRVRHSMTEAVPESKATNALSAPPIPIFNAIKNSLTSPSQRPTVWSVLETEVRYRDGWGR